MMKTNLSDANSMFVCGLEDLKTLCGVSDGLLDFKFDRGKEFSAFCCFRFLSVRKMPVF